MESTKPEGRCPIVTVSHSGVGELADARDCVDVMPVQRLKALLARGGDDARGNPKMRPGELGKIAERLVVVAELWGA